MKSPEWRRQLRRADLRQFQIFRHGPVIIYTRLPAGGTYYSICMFPTNSECLIGNSDAFSAFVYGYPSSCPRAQCTPNKSVATLRYTRRQGPVYIQAMPVGTCRVQSTGFPKIVYLPDCGDAVYLMASCLEKWTYRLERKEGGLFVCAFVSVHLCLRV